MSTLNIQIPESLHASLRELAEREGVSVEQLAVVALAEKASALIAYEYLQRRAQRGDREAFERVLSKVPDVEPDPEDRL